MPVDYVIPFVDSSDREWVEEYRKYAPSDCSWSSNATRFRDWDILRYLLRSIARHLPWIHRIYIVLSISKTQVPKLLKTENEKIRVVWDWEFDTSGLSSGTYTITFTLESGTEFEGTFNV